MNPRLRLFLLHRQVQFIVGIFLGIVFYELVVVPVLLAPSSSSSTCPAKANEEGGRMLALLVEPKLHSTDGQPHMEIKASKRLFQGLPKTHRTNFQTPCGKNCHPVIRSLRTLGWTKVDVIEDAKLVHTGVVEAWYSDGHEQSDERKQLENTTTPDSLRSWQRYNHIYNSSAWGKKSHMLDGFARYRTKPNHRYPYFLPETYRLSVEIEKEAFSGLFSKKGAGRKHSWILTTGKTLDAKKVSFPARSKKIEAAIRNRDNDFHTAQKAICEPLKWSDGNNLIVRVFWLVASVDPVLAFYQDGYARIGYETNTTNTLTKDHNKVPFGDVEHFLRALPPRRKKTPLTSDPVQHVRNQFKESVAIFVDAFRDSTFRNREDGTAVEDAYEIYALDFVIDQNLDVWLHNALTDTRANKFNPFMTEDYYFLLQKKHEVYYGALKTLSGIWDKQEKGQNILPLADTGSWELVVAKDWKYQYDGYVPTSRRKICKADDKRIRAREK